MHYKIDEFRSCIVINQGDGTFDMRSLPMTAQVSPIKDILIVDFNHDGIKDVIIAGNMYGTEVETIRYDESRNYVLSGDKAREFQFINDVSYFNTNEAKAIKKIVINNQVHFIILNKNSGLKILRLREQS